MTWTYLNIFKCAIKMATMKSLRNSSVTFHNDVVHGSRVYHSYSLKTTSGRL